MRPKTVLVEHGSHGEACGRDVTRPEVVSETESSEELAVRKCGQGRKKGERRVRRRTDLLQNGVRIVLFLDAICCYRFVIVLILDTTVLVCILSMILLL